MNTYLRRSYSADLLSYLSEHRWIDDQEMKRVDV